MFSWLLERRLTAFEESYDYDASYAREILELSPKALVTFYRAAALGQYRRNVSREAWYAARLVSIIAEDCGPCTQLTVTMAERAGVAPELIAKLIAGDFEELPEPVRVTARFAQATLRRDPEADELRNQVEQHFGRLGLLSIAFAITAARIYPTLKYALGYGRACQRVIVNGKPVVAHAKLTSAPSKRHELGTLDSLQTEAIAG